MERIGPSLVDVEDFHRNGAGFERRGEGLEGGDVGFGEHAEDVDRGKVEDLDQVDEQNADADCGFGSHCF